MFMHRVTGNIMAMTGLPMSTRNVSITDTGSTAMSAIIAVTVVTVVTAVIATTGTAVAIGVVGVVKGIGDHIQAAPCPGKA